ncbi:bifunctional diaminohydroxyphosphoribosylaminopyrimidine deaminase/5-amino-6-(5-phosphoribosylamino)uracil reductase RibD [Marinobacterium arenosum]|uniref:bifunctional diaminohydroxyphosphoribosylaminopyrimidine deaminase/5-amino-6-(5-phosphoribosylamino)uracil reductase RibD n=1 Tax=Marinobacterium arenosum TaxID=2862496 RepID=UPI001C94E9F6|nr:bifunctional diaminohydroxyphosphoribosylaminopyrimidine deaminase/5-amino-6-(5-phosphoribosylamino)uracil reductase RibD [Marinobacterium arenosum]MBY4675550.1 bifunctional diaminohydroxyphosphoribosylaminopyrimidine deaminase/5-amino-6-(5-phosphoribosylamino)uracil reductase RibD [Marinobacterium arenosum]
MTAFSIQDREFMARAIRLARRGLYTTAPNPRVGCVLVKDGLIVGEGFHLRAGEGHAEVNALRHAGEQARGATAYVTLEPCSHHGRTPPCAEGLIRAGVARVVAGMVDPNPQVAGRGMKLLAEAAVVAEHGLLEAQARELNPGFIKRMEQGMPLVTLKLAGSLDGRTAMRSGESQWITGPQARRQVQRLRARSCAIISGVESILQDDSALTVRETELGLDNAAEIVCRQPLRVVLDSRLRTPPDANILKQAGRTLLVHVGERPGNEQALKLAGAELLALPALDGRVDLSALLRYLAQHEQCNEVLVETGATLAGAFVEQQLADRLVLFMAPTLMGSDGRPLLELPLTRMAQQIPLKVLDCRQVGGDLCFTLQPKYREAD